MAKFRQIWSHRFQATFRTEISIKNVKIKISGGKVTNKLSSLIDVTSHMTSLNQLRPIHTSVDSAVDSCVSADR